MNDERRDRVAVVIPYFGKFPVYWSVTLASMGRNTGVDWHLFTDQQLDDVPANVIVHPSSLAAMRARLADRLGHPVAVPDAYKLCDFKPTYGLVFEEELRGYAYWGYGDVDVVWGDLLSYIAPAVEAGYDRIGTFGHLTLLRNTPELARAFQTEIRGIPTAKAAFTTERHVSYDEFGGWNALSKALGIKTYDEPIAFDMFVASYRLRANRSRRLRDDTVFAWDGRCLELDPTSGKIVSEAAYIHLQKRAMRRPAASLPALTGSGALAFGPVDIVSVDSLEDVPAAVRRMETSPGSWWRWNVAYARLRVRRASRRLRREVRDAIRRPGLGSPGPQSSIATGARFGVPAN